MDADEEAWLEQQLAISRDYNARLAIILEATETATEHESGCDVCVHILTMIPKEVPEFVASFDRAGPVLDRERIPVGIWTFPRRDFLWHERRHGG